MLEFRELSKSYAGKKALDGMSFSVPCGEVVGFLGPNGAGKTTAMRSVFGLVELDSGQVIYQGGQIRPGQLQRFGYMPEERGLYPKMTVLAHLVYLARLHDVHAAEAKERALALVEKLEISGGPGAKIESLSLGNSQRTQVAAALIHQPEVLILDEPFSSLDPLSIEIVKGMLEEYAREGATVLFSSHQLELVEGFCKSVAIANQGRIVLAGAVEALTESQTRLVVRVREDPEGSYLEGLEGVSRLGSDPNGQRIEVQDDGAARRVLEAAMTAGTVLRYDHVRRSLVEVFREAVESTQATGAGD
ncbi:MAG: ATP-binding cassette domain-containing protein [Actinomycetota bacterium]|nr:ATP-binding cassette domain-containing protein [Actinomycetota bacterium]